MAPFSVPGEFKEQKRKNICPTALHLYHQRSPVPLPRVTSVIRGVLPRDRARHWGSTCVNTCHPNGCLGGSDYNSLYFMYEETGQRGCGLCWPPLCTGAWGDIGPGLLVSEVQLPLTMIFCHSPASQIQKLHSSPLLSACSCSFILWLRGWHPFLGQYSVGHAAVTRF